MGRLIQLVAFPLGYLLTGMIWPSFHEFVFGNSDPGFGEEIPIGPVLDLVFGTGMAVIASALGIAVFWPLMATWSGQLHLTVGLCAGSAALILHMSGILSSLGLSLEPAEMLLVAQMISLGLASLLAALHLRFCR